MTAKELAEGVRFVVDGHGQVTNVVLTLAAWQQLIDRIEDADDRRLLEELAPKLASGPGGAVRWSEVEGDWA